MTLKELESEVDVLQRIKIRLPMVDALRHISSFFTNEIDFAQVLTKDHFLPQLKGVFHKLEDFKLHLQAQAPTSQDLMIFGPFESRSIIFSTSSIEDKILVTINHSVKESPFYLAHKDEMILKEHLGSVALVKMTEATYAKLKKPRVHLVGLYHPENFPLPRFHLGISDICRSIREQHQAEVHLTDMQFSKTVREVYEEVCHSNPDIVGLSVTFGQQDILEELLDLFNANPAFKPLIVIGGSLAALNYERILERTSCLVGLAEGEPTFSDIIHYFHQRLPLHEIRNIAYKDAKGKLHKTKKDRPFRAQEGIPELDLLEQTLSHKGVMQLESTRGCSYACSFCPRSHKGVWTHQSVDLFQKLLPEVSEIFKHYPKITKKIFLVDEEFVGYKEDDTTNSRISTLSMLLKQYQFKFETSARVDQVYRRQKDDLWHSKRLDTWRELVRSGLDRVLFGVESGVDSILERFNKKTKKEQNINAIRLLSAAQIPIRLTYITFDPLMSVEELLESYHFLSNRTFIMKPLTHLSSEEIVKGIQDPAFLEENSRQQPLYEHITYMLVSMECLIGSNYLKVVEEKGLAREYVYQMGKRKADFIVPEIGLLSHCSQLWIDRNFSLDYTLKSIEKITSGTEKSTIRTLRRILKRFAHDVLGVGVKLLTQDSKISVNLSSQAFQEMQTEWETTVNFSDRKKIFIQFLDHHFDALVCEVLEFKKGITEHLPEEVCDILFAEMNKWKVRKEWSLINDQ